MPSVLTIRHVPDEVKTALARDASDQGKSLQAFLLGVLERQAGLGRNAELLTEIEQDLQEGGGASADAPDTSDVLARERSREGQTAA